MTTRFSSREFLLFSLVIGIGLAWLINTAQIRTQNGHFESRLTQLKDLNQDLKQEENRLANETLELNHFLALADDKGSTLNPILNAQRRKFATQIRIDQIKVDTLRLLEPVSPPPKPSKLDVVQTEIGFCENLLAKVENDSNFDPRKIKRIKKQLRFFESQAAAEQE